MPRKKSDGTSKKQATSGGLKDGKSTGKEKNLPVPDTKAPFPIVGIGVSAGGLEAFEQFFTHTPADTGMAFVLIQHLDPKHKSILSELVRRFTNMPVHEVDDGMAVEPNTVFVIPPNRNMAILNGNLHLLEPSDIPGVRTPIDFFFRSLAQDRKEETTEFDFRGKRKTGEVFPTHHTVSLLKIVTAGMWASSVWCETRAERMKH